MLWAGQQGQASVTGSRVGLGKSSVRLSLGSSGGQCWVQGQGLGDAWAQMAAASPSSAQQQVATGWPGQQLCLVAPFCLSCLSLARVGSRKGPGWVTQSLLGLIKWPPVLAEDTRGLWEAAGSTETENI